MYNQTNQNFQSTQLLRAFFAKPLTLAIAICSSVAVLLSVVFPFIENGIPSPDINSALFAIAFFMLYFKSKSPNPCPSFKAPLNIIMIASIIQSSMTAILIIALISALLFSFLFIIFLPLVLALWSLLISFLLISSLYLTYYIGLALSANSMKKALKTGKFRKKGVVFAAVIGIILFSLFALIALFSFFPFDSLSSGAILLPDEDFSSMMSFSPATTNNLTVATLSESDLPETGILTSISFLSSVTSYLLTAILLLNYHSYIKTASAHYTPVAHKSYANQVYRQQTQVNIPPQQNNFGGPAVPTAMNYNQPLTTNVNFGNENYTTEKTCPTCGTKADSSVNICLSADLIL